MDSASERRKQARNRKILPESLCLFIEEHPGQGRTKIPAKLIETAENGLRVRTEAPLKTGAPLYLDRQALRGGGQPELWKARVVWCGKDSQGRDIAGLHMEAPASPETQEKSTEEFQDYYEVLQLSPKAGADTVQRVYRILAQRFHPDNPETGSEEEFKKLLAAYRVLSDPEQRASYDVLHTRETKLRWKIFAPGKAARGRESEQRMRAGILAILYARRASEPTRPTAAVTELEELLGCPREHLEFNLWFLREKGLIARGDNGRFTITANGVEQAESTGVPWNSSGRLLHAAQA